MKFRFFDLPLKRLLCTTRIECTHDPIYLAGLFNYVYCELIEFICLNLTKNVVYHNILSKKQKIHFGYKLYGNKKIFNGCKDLICLNSILSKN